MKKNTVLLIAVLLVLFLATCLQAAPSQEKPHPKHEVTEDIFKFQKRTLHVVTLPRCEHLDVFFTNNPRGETVQQAKLRIKGIAASTGCYYHTGTYKAVDLLRRDGVKLSDRNAGRYFLIILPSGELLISNNSKLLELYPDADAVALGQILVPFSFDGFSVRFANKITQRMALGFTKDRVYIVSGKSNLWTLSKFMKEKLNCDIAINCDGGHTVRGHSPFHLVFRWKNLP